MKKLLVLSFIASTMVLASCGSSRQVNSSNYNAQLQQKQNQQVQSYQVPKSEQMPQSVKAQTRVARPEEPCEALSWERDLAAAGTATSYNEKVARNEAIRDARYELGRMMQVAVEGAAEDYLRNVTKNRKSTSETISEEINSQFFSECVKNSKVIKTTVYDLSDGQIQVYACVEVVAGFDVLEKAAEVAENVLSRDEVLETEFNKEQFKSKMKEGLQQYKESRVR